MTFHIQLDPLQEGVEANEAMVYVTRIGDRCGIRTKFRWPPSAEQIEAVEVGIEAAIEREFPGCKVEMRKSIADSPEAAAEVRRFLGGGQG